MENIRDFLVLIAACCSALLTIYNFISASAKKIKQASKDEIAESVAEKLEPKLDEVKEINVEQSRKIELLNQGQLDLLRQQILYLYEHHYKTQSLTKDEMEQLHKLFKDYTAEGGNSFVSQIYQTMKNWSIVPNND